MNGPDEHRREANELWADKLIAREEQRKRNAAEWIRRGHVAWDEGNSAVAYSCWHQAEMASA